MAQPPRKKLARTPMTSALILVTVATTFSDCEFMMMMMMMILHYLAYHRKLVK